MSYFRNQQKGTLGKLWSLMFLVGMFFFSVSCVTNRKIVYVQPGKDKKVEFETVIKKARTIEPGDELYIQVSTEDQEPNIFTGNRYGMMMNDITLISYLVSETGFIRFPIIGNIKMEGLTVDEGASVIEKALIGILSTPSVSVRFVNKNVTVLGAVNNPGRYTFTDQSINILQALGYAGDISYYGNRKKVMVLREENNVITRNYIDLTDESLLSSYYYTLKPNDVVYVEPFKRRKWGMQTFPINLIFSVISTTVLILSYMHIYK